MNLNELWHSRDMVFDEVGSIQVKEFAMAVYKELVKIEDMVLRGNEKVPGICGLRMFLRMDTALIWDDTDSDVRKHRYRFVLNEVQPADASLFMIDGDCRNSIVRAFVAGIQRGGLEQ